MDMWKGNLTLQDGTSLDDLQLHVHPAAKTARVHIPPICGSTLRFLSLIETVRLPLHIALGPQYDVVTGSAETEAWFSSLLLNATPPTTGDEEKAQWWEQARIESPLGVLAAVDTFRETPDGWPRVTEVLFYATSQHSQTGGRPATPPHSSPGPEQHGRAFTLNAILLSSDLLYHPPEATPPWSPLIDDDDAAEAVLLPPRYRPIRATLPEPVNELPVKKRRSVNDTFDEAAERRKKARRNGGEGVGAVASRIDLAAAKLLKHRRTTSADSEALRQCSVSTMPSTDAVPIQTRPLSRSASVASRPGSIRAPSEVPRRSTLCRVQSVSALREEPTESTRESKNKDTISRIIMAGMRLYGFVQSKSRKSRPSSAATSPTLGISVEQREEERRRDEEYKPLYHQVLKGACFAFRHHVASESLQHRPDAVRNVVDKLLVLYCADPLAGGFGVLTDERTPGGRKAFGSAAADDHI